MDFNFKKPLHIIALLLIIISFVTLIILPILSFESTEIPDIPDSYGLIFEIFLLVFQLIFTVLIMIFFPILWYIFVNKHNIKQVFSTIKLTFQNIDKAFLWGFLTAFLIYIIVLIFGVFANLFLGIDTQDISNIPQLETLFSPATLFLLVAIQPVAEEIFFRGFLLEKIDKFAGPNFAIFTTALLFGLAHAMYNDVFPVVIAMVMGILLAYVVIKTKNLFTSIIAHIIYNVGALALYYLSQSLI